MWDREYYFLVEVIKKVGELGFCGLYVFESVGGLGLFRFDFFIIFE